MSQGRIKSTLSIDNVFEHSKITFNNLRAKFQPHRCDLTVGPACLYASRQTPLKKSMFWPHRYDTWAFRAPQHRTSRELESHSISEYQGIVGFDETRHHLIMPLMLSRQRSPNPWLHCPLVDFFTALFSHSSANQITLDRNPSSSLAKMKEKVYRVLFARFPLLVRTSFSSTCEFPNSMISCACSRAIIQGYDG